MSMSYLPPAVMRRSPSAPRSFVTLAKVSRDSVSKSVSSALGFVNMRYGTSCSAHCVAQINSIWHPTVSTTETRLGSTIFTSDSPAKIAQRGFQHHVVGTEFLPPHGRVQGIRLLGGAPKLIGEAGGLNVESSCGGHLVAQPRCVAQTAGLAAIDAIVNGVEGQDRIRQYGRLDTQVLSPDVEIRRGEIFRLELQATESRILRNTPIEQDLSAFDIGLGLIRDPLITAVLNQHRTRHIVQFSDMVIGGDRRFDFDIRENTKLRVLLQRGSISLADVSPEVEEKARAVLEAIAEVAVLAQIDFRVENSREYPAVLEKVIGRRALLCSTRSISASTRSQWRSRASGCTRLSTFQSVSAMVLRGTVRTQSS